MTIIKKYQLISFFLIAYAISWILWLPMLFLKEEAVVANTIFLLAGGFGPMISGIIVSRLAFGKQGILDYKTRIFMWRVGLKNYLGALLIPILIYLLAYGVYLILGGSPMDFSKTPSILVYPLSLVFVCLLGGGLEEPGWRGFALPRLQNRYNPILSSVVLGVIWVFWHLPLFLSQGTSQSGLHFGWYLLNGIGLSIIFTLLHNRSGGSALIAIILHGGVNAPSSWYPFQGNINGFLGQINPYAPITIATWIIVLILIGIWKPDLKRKHPFELQSGTRFSL